MAARTGRTISLALAWLALGSAPSLVLAQGNAFNPYGNSGYADYREFTTPTYSNSPALPGQARLDGEPLITRPRPNSYRQYVDEDQGEFESNLARRGTSAGTPYNEAYRQLNRQYNRVYKPNDSVKNDEFVERLKQRDEAYAKALKEKDPVKRSKMLREIEKQSLDKPTESAKSKTATASRGTTPAPAPPGSAASRAPAPPGSGSATNRGDRRTAPAPPPSGTRTRPSSSSTTTPPPVSGTTGGSGSTTSRPAPDPSTIPAPPR